MDAASLNKPSVCSTVMMRRGMPAGSATASTATGSGGAMAAPRTMAAATPKPASRKYAAVPTANAVATTNSTERLTMVRHCSRITPQLVRRASAHSSGGRKIGRMRSAGISTAGMPGTKTAAVAGITRSAGHGNPTRSPMATMMTVPMRRPTRTNSIPMCIFSL